MRKTFLALVLLSANTYAMEVPQIQVQGNCEIKVVPDRGTITFTSENQSKDQKEAVKKTNDQINKLKDAHRSSNRSSWHTALRPTTSTRQSIMV